MAKNDIKIVMKKLNEITPYENNPRNNEVAVDKVVKSIQQFGFKVPIVIDKDGTIVTGHTRYLASQKLGLEKVPCILADDLSPDEVKAYRLVDNKVSEYATWDVQMLQKELKDLEDFDLTEYDFDDIEGYIDNIDTPASEGENGDNPYTFTIQLPEYTPKGEKVATSDLVDTSKCDELIEQIDSSEIPDEIKAFLRLSAQRHLVFDYAKIAEFYAQTDAQTQDLMERSGLVIIDYEKAIEYGFMNLIQEIEDLRGSGEDDGTE